MKRILSMLLAVIMALGCFAVMGSALVNTDAGEISFNSSYDATKYTTTYVCTKMVTKSSSGEKSTVTKAYNSKGYLAKNKSDFGSETYSYDSKGNLTKSIGVGTPNIYCTYNSSGNLIKYKEKDTGTCSYSYNSSGRIIKEKYSSNYLNYVISYSYNSKGQICQTKTKEGSGTSTATYTYNSKGLLTKIKADKYTYTYTYDSKGNLTKAVNKYSSGDAYAISYSYNSKGYLTKVSHRESDSAYTYDSHGNRTKESFKSFDNNDTTTYTYKKITTNSPVIAGRIHIQYASARYTGKAKKPNVTIDGLNKGVDYKVTYSNNVKVGTAKAKITFLGENATQQPVTITYKITK